MRLLLRSQARTSGAASQELGRNRGQEDSIPKSLGRNRGQEDSVPTGLGRGGGRLAGPPHNASSRLLLCVGADG